MDCDVCMLDLLLDEFPKIDERIIKATVLEHGDDVKSAFIFLRSLALDDDEEDTSLRGDEGTECFRSSTREVQQNSFVGENCDSGTVAVPQEDAFIESNTEAVNPELSNSISQISLTSLEDIVEDAKKDKEIVINLVEEVSNLRGNADQERAAALRAKNEAAASGEDLSRKADELRKKSAQKKQDNLLRMGEIYGEKAVLATEARGLKLRLEQVKLQREKAVTILNEIKGTLQVSCEEALEEKLIAEEDGRGKKKLAEDNLRAEETLLAAIEEESRKLDIEAQSCLQLKEFLSCHGSIIDAIQGEMCVLCEDVESFKRQVDGGMWSSISTESLPANVNPEGPYIFRKYKAASISSSQESGQSFEALCGSKQFGSILSSPASQGMTGNTGKLSNGSSQVNDVDVQQRFSSEESDVWGHGRAWSSSIFNQMNTGLHGMLVFGSDRNSSVSVATDEKGYFSPENILHSESHFGEGTELMSSNFTDDDGRGHFKDGRSFKDSVGMSKVSPSGSQSNRSWASSKSDDGCEDPVICDRPGDSTNDGHDIAEKFTSSSAPQADGKWFFSPMQMEESTSSTSSSLVKVEADDYELN